MSTTPFFSSTPNSSLLGEPKQIPQFKLLLNIQIAMITIHLQILLSFFLFSLVLSLEDDIRCLQGFKNTLTDPQHQLNSWNFTNTTTEISFSGFVGVSTWTSRVIALQLPSMELGGEITDSLQYCGILQILDLSDNSFVGTIPSIICDWFPYLVSLDLSRNNLSGSIPTGLGNCIYLNHLNLSYNNLTGLIPHQLSRLSLLKTLSLANNNLVSQIPKQLGDCMNLSFINFANNHLYGPIPDEFERLQLLTTLYLANNNLSGPIPSFLSNFSCADFIGNSGLYGPPLGSNCGVKKKKNLNFKIIIAAGFSGAVVSLLLGFMVRCGKKRIVTGWDDDRNWVERLRPHSLVEVSLFSEPIEKIKLGDLMIATNNFDPENIIISARTGCSYKAILTDGSALAIKRLQNCKLNDKQFHSEISRLEQLRHPNLVPLLGFCIVEDEKLLVYKHMPNGSLYSLLHCSGNTGQLDWPTRLRIGIGMAKGLAWLHHGSEPPSIHHNITSQTVLLDEDLDARITDFGLAQIVNREDESTSIRGEFENFGYIAPEYISSAIASVKGDVYAFGVVLLELATSQKPLDERNADKEFKGGLVEWINGLSDSGRIRDAIYKSLLGKGHDDEILEFLKIAFGCVVSKPKDRSSMDQVYYSLKTIAEAHGFSEQFE